MGSATGRRLSRLALVALATLVVIIATASACENEELNRLVEKAPPPGATVVDEQQCTSGTLAAPRCAAIWLETGDMLPTNRVNNISKHAATIGLTLVQREELNGFVFLTFDKSGFSIKYAVLPDSYTKQTECESPPETMYTECFDSIYITEAD